MISRPDSLLNPQRMIGALIKLLFAAIYCFGLSRLILELLGLPTSHGLQAGVILLVLIMLAGLTWQRYNLLIFGGLWLLLLMAAVIFREQINEPAVKAFGRLADWLNWAASYLANRGGEVPQRSLEVLSLVICILLAAACYLSLARFNRPGLALTALLFVGAGHTLFVSGGLLWAGMAGIAVIAATARDQKRAYQGLDWIRYPAQAHFMLESLPIAAIGLTLALLASAIWPATAWQSPALALRLDMLRGDLGIFDQGIIPSSGEIYEFSLESSGYYPLGNRLGGPVILSDEPVMTVSGYPEGLLLRGSIAAVYTGQRWLPGGDVNLYDFHEPAYAQQRQQVFDLSRPVQPLDRSDLQFIFSEDHTYLIQPASTALTTVFLAGRPLNFSLNDLIPKIYFNSEGLLFIQPALNASQVLKVDSRFIMTDYPSFPELEATIADQADPGETDYFQKVSELYLQLPDIAAYQAEGSLSLLVISIIDPDATPWAQASQIRDYLIANCRYNLRVPPPPAGRDFVEFFLESREGYCVYFATAETMLCRLAGIPARYVEGYTVSPGTTQDEPRIVTGRQAHAWTEVFLEGIGWVPIDATAGAPPVEADLSPTPTLLPGKPTPDGEDPATPTPGNGAVSPTPKPSITPENRPFAAVLRELAAWLGDLSPWWLLLLLLLPVFYLPWAIVRYRRRYEPAWLARHYPAPRKLIIYCWNDVLDILRQLGSRRQTWETPRQYIGRVQEQTTWLSGRRPEVEKMLAGVEKAIYSENNPDPDEVMAMTHLRLIMEKTLRQNTSRLLFVLRRIWYHKQKRELDDEYANH